jgi:inward rectifier potassium channel
MGWGRFLLIVATFYVVVNGVFAVAYLACGSGTLAGPGFAGHSALFSDYFRAYFFSVETFGTIGYGNIAPVGMSANILVTAESFVGLLSAALATGLVFARFSRPNAAILYSRHALIAPYRGIKAFMFRCANERSNQLIEVSVRIMYSRIAVRPNGDRVREFTSLPLEFDKVTFFALSWTVVHPIDESSPLFHCTAETLAANEAEFLVLLSGNDETFAQTVHSRTSYKASEIIWNARFRSMFIESKSRGTTGMDLARIHDFERVEA